MTQLNTLVLSNDRIVLSCNDKKKKYIVIPIMCSIGKKLILFHDIISTDCR